MTHPLADLSELDRFKTGAFAPGYPGDTRTFYSPVDDLHGALKFCLAAAQRSLVLAMYGFDDQELAGIIKTKLSDPAVFVQLTLDKSQAGGVHERTILSDENYPQSSVAIGSSEHGAIMHMKMAIVDGTVLVSGSTNWSDGAEAKQDNELTVSFSPVRSAEARMRIDAIHAHMLTRAGVKSVHYAPGALYVR